MLPFDALVLNKYRILRSPQRRDGLLGRGTYGSVYLAYEELADRHVAIKVLNVDAAELESGQEDALRRFLTEGRLGLRVRHPNILEVYAIEPYDTGYLLVMELAESGDLKALLAQGRPPLAESVAIGWGIAEGLQAAHDRAIIHRDLKPGNVFLVKDGTPKVADFGVAHIPQAVGGYLSLTRTGFQPGTIIYMSPEQAAGGRIDHRSDLYSLAVMLYELLAGTFYVDLRRCRELAQSRSGSTPALEELRFFQVFAETAFSGPAPRPSSVNPAIPPWLDTVIERGLARDPADRWQNGRDFATALRAGGLADLPASEPSTIERTLVDPLTPQSPRPPMSGAVYPPPFDTPPTPSFASRPADAARPETHAATPAASAPSAPGAVAPTPGEASTTSPPGARYVRPPRRDRTPPLDPPAGSETLSPPAPAYEPWPARADDAAVTAVPVVAEPQAPAAPGAPSGPLVDPAVTGEASVTPPAVLPALPPPAGLPGTSESPAATAAHADASASPRAANQGERIAPPKTVRQARWPFAAAAVVVLLLIGGTLAVWRPWVHNPTPPAPSAQPSVVAALITPAAAQPAVSATTAATASPSPSPSATPSPTPTPDAASVPDSLITRPGATLVQRLNVPASGGVPGYVVAYTQTPGADGCQQPHIDLLTPSASGGQPLSRAWESASQPNGAPLLDVVKKGDNGCFPTVRALQASPLEQGGPPAPLAVVGLSDGSARVLALSATTPSTTVKALYDLHTTPNAQVSFGPDLPAVMTVMENAYPPPSSGLNPQYSQPIASLSATYRWNGSGFALSAGSLAPFCTSGTIAAVAQAAGGTALLAQCPDGSAGPYVAALLDGGTSFPGGIAASDLAAGDDIILTFVPESLSAADPLQALPKAASAGSQAALARKQAREAPPAPVQAPAPSRSSAGSGSAGGSSGAPAPAPAPAQPAPAPQQSNPAPPQPQPVATTPPQPVQAAPPQPVNTSPAPPPGGGSGGLGGGGGAGSGGGGLGGGGAPGTGGGGLGG